MTFKHRTQHAVFVMSRDFDGTGRNLVDPPMGGHPPYVGYYPATDLDYTDADTYSLLRIIQLTWPEFSYLMA